MGFLVVFFGAGIGGAARQGVNLLSARLFGLNFPYGTMIINVAGCFLMGLIAGYFALRGHLPQEMRLFLMTGILGGFTTFSAFSLDAITLWERGAVLPAALYVVGSVFASLLAVFLGLALIRFAIGAAA